MSAHRTRILCIGNDSLLLETRVSVLNHAGYVSQAALVSQAGDVLRTDRFDLIILSVILTDEEKAHIVKIVDGSTPVLALTKMVSPGELLREVEKRPPQNRPFQSDSGRVSLSE